MIAGFWAGNTLIKMENWAEKVATQLLQQKIDANGGVLDDKYKGVIGSLYPGFETKSP